MLCENLGKQNKLVPVFQELIIQHSRETLILCREFIGMKKKNDPREQKLKAKWMKRTKSKEDLLAKCQEKIRNFEEEDFPMERVTSDRKTGKKRSRVQNEEEPVSAPMKKKRRRNEKRIATISVALPGSILSQTKKKEVLVQHIGAQVARILGIFQIDEVIVFNEDAKEIPEGNFIENPQSRNYGEFEPNVHLANILYFQETPPFLRYDLFPLLPELKFSGTFVPLIIPNHLNEGRFREGIVKKANPKAKKVEVFFGSNTRCIVNCSKSSMPFPSLNEKICIRVRKQSPKMFEGEQIDKLYPRAEFGKYFGYKVRLVNKLSKVWSECPFESGYDLTVGTSVKGENIDSYEMNNGSSFPYFRHLLVVFGSPKFGLSRSFSNDKGSFSRNNMKECFNLFLNVCPTQGTKTIRTEEAMMITLSQLRKFVDTNRTRGIRRKPLIPLAHQQMSDD